ncbi:FkbM family methyltransferase [Yoonia sp. SS1-5]|uniref:FkbM family methyltransferase n=1 Tax=Yoonia rhodophyticola TaxID=3137370 RepID=A0AAN0NJ06_9RHOB
MSFLVKTPHHTAIAKAQPYAQYIDVLNRKTTAVQRELFRGGSGGYEHDMQATLLSVCEFLGPNCVFFDVGAHVGYYAAMAQTIFGHQGIKITAFEPTPDTAAAARSIRQVNQLSYEIVESAVTDVPGTVELFLSPKAETSNSLNAEFREGSKPVEVPATTIDAFSASQKVYPDFLKIDVETFEHAVLTGAMQTIAAVKPVISCELLRSGNFSDTTPVLQQLEKIGYRFYQISQAADWPVRTAHQVEGHLDETLRDWLFLPYEMPAELQTMIAAWRVRLMECTKDTNILVSRRGSFLQQIQRLLQMRRLMKARWTGDE